MKVFVAGPLGELGLDRGMALNRGCTVLGIAWLLLLLLLILFIRALDGAADRFDFGDEGEFITTTGD
jgi:hypothetical protein